METTFEFDPALPPAQQELVREAIAMADRFFRAHGFAETARATVFAHTTLNGLAEAYAQCYDMPVAKARDRLGKWRVALSGPGALFLDLSASEFNEWPIERRLDIIIHEYFHVLQIQLADDRIGVADEEVVKRGPRWLIEGSAEYVGWRVLDANYKYRFSNAEADQKVQARSITVPLQSMETWAGTKAAGKLYGYSLAFMATNFLLDVSGTEVSSLSVFYERIGRGVTWQTAFQETFGKNIEAFYGEFKEFRRAQLPPLPRLSGIIRNSTGTPLPGIHVWASPVVLRDDYYGYAVTGADGSYTMDIREGTYRLQLSYSANGTDPSGYYSPAGFTADANQATVIVVPAGGIAEIDIQIPSEATPPTYRHQVDPKKQKP